MRTKTLLIAAAALAVGLATSMAQTTYSQNIVGYANVVLHGMTTPLTLVANPFDDGNGNVSSNLVLNTLLPKQSRILTWNGGSFNVIQNIGSPANWNGVTTLPPGVGFFVRNGPGVGDPTYTGTAPDVTNTFVGNVIVNVGGSVTNDIPVGSSLQGSPIPYAGNLAISGSNDGDANMNFGGGLSKTSRILTWNIPGQTYNLAQKIGATPTWNATATVGVAEGFFIVNNNAGTGTQTNVVETLNP